MELLELLGPFEKGGILGVCVTEVLTPNDSRSWMPEPDDAKKKGVTGLMDRKAFEVVLKEDVPPNVNILEGLFVLALKNIGNNNEKFKVCFVMPRRTDAEKNMPVHNSSNVKQQSARLLIVLAAIFGFRVWIQDVSQELLQSASKLTHEVYWQHNEIFILKRN